MLKRLTIQNYALIDRIEVKFDSGLHILTGETGAGKSIILGALGLVMGNRADSKSLYEPDQNCLVEASFDISAYNLSAWLQANDIDPEDELIIRRVISTSGKSRAFINDLPVALKTLQDLSNRLVQMHNQFDNLDLGQPDFQLQMLDALAGNHSLLERFRTDFRQLKQAKSDLARLLSEVEQFRKEKDFIRFQYDELTEAELESAIEEDLENTLEIMSHAESIQQALQSAYFSLADEEDAVLNRIKAISRELQQAGRGTAMMNDLSKQLQDSADELEEISRTILDKTESIEHDPERIDELQQKMDTINRLLHKHKLKEIRELIELRDELESKLSRDLEVSSSIRSMEKNIEAISLDLSAQAKVLSEKRRAISDHLCIKVEEELHQLGMPHAKMRGVFSPVEELGPDGTDHFELLFSANKGSEPAPIREVASGGELSRLSLSIKSLLAGHMHMPTLIFDEIEAGISGEIALKMGKILRDLSNRHQVINITHSAQIASRGRHHFFVYKSHEGNRSVTRIRELNQEERINEIAKMLSGDPPSPNALKNATELIQLN